MLATFRTFDIEFFEAATFDMLCTLLGGPDPSVAFLPAGCDASRRKRAERSP